jgi:DNA repair protein RecN (Recombination protein N)
MRRWDSATGVLAPGRSQNCITPGKQLSNLCYDWSSLFSLMLRYLRITRLAVIDEVEVEFGPGLNVLTGETGAGKSILVGAVGLLLGGRASGDLVRTGEESATVEAIFEGAGDDELLIRREVTAQGRSRAFVNGELATAGALKDLSARLLELHGQHEHHVLLDPNTHLAMLDAFAGLDAGRAAAAFAAMRDANAALERVRQAAADRGARQELLAFQAGELDRAAPTPGEDEDLAATRQVLASAERVERWCRESYTSLYENDGSILAQLGGVWRRVAELAALDPRFQPYLEGRDAVKSQLEDLALFLRQYADGIEASPERLQRIEERLALLERLKRKYGPALADVMARRVRIRTELDEIDRTDERLADLAREHQAARTAFLAAAGELSTARHTGATRFARQLELLLGELAMDRTAFEVRFNPEPLPESAWSASGTDAVEFFVSPNVGEETRPLARIVSGGELSRIMLAVKTLTATGRHGFDTGAERRPGESAPGMIFDEVDAGIGGRAADVVGRKLHALGSAFQVLCITHLPQIAAYADRHYSIEKRVDGGRTQTRVTRLDEDGRVGELARMLGGEAVTDGLRGAAREMLNGRRNQSSEAKGESNAKGESESGAVAPSRRARPGRKGD